MHPFFTPLSERETVLLLTTLMVGGSDQTHLFAHVPGDAGARLRDRAQALLALETDKRVPFMARELRNALARNGLRGVERIDPSWIVRALRGQSPRVVGAVLLGLPPQLVRSVLKRLPEGVREKLPPKQELKQAPSDLLEALRLVFESQFEPMPVHSSSGLAFRDILHLDRSELFVLMRDLGLIELGQAFVTVGKMALVELCRRLPRDKADELVAAVGAASTLDLPDERSAQRFLSRVVVNFNDTEEFFQKSGLWRLARASVGEDKTFVAALRQRLPRAAGHLLEQYLVRAVELGVAAADNHEARRRLQDAILLRVLSLSRRAKIGSQWAQMQIVFHDPAAAAQADAETLRQEAAAQSRGGLGPRA